MRPRCHLAARVAILAAAMALAAVAVQAAQPWTSIGPWGGQVNALVIDPSAPATLYAATYAGGVYKTVDGGESWTALSGVPRQASVLSSRSHDPGPRRSSRAPTATGFIVRPTAARAGSSS